MQSRVKIKEVEEEAEAEVEVELVVELVVETEEMNEITELTYPEEI